MDISSLGNVAAITVICLLVASILKSTKINCKWLPALCGLMGGLLGLAGFYLMVDFPAQDIMTAIAAGILSGFAATGIHQVYKQMKKR